MSSSCQVVSEELVGSVITLCLAGVGVDAQRRAIAQELDAGRTPRAKPIIDALCRGLRNRPSEDAVERVRRRMSGQRVAVLVPGYVGYPPRLLQAWPELGAPLWVFRCVQSSPASDRLPAGPAVAVVGTRHPTADGIRVAEALATSLAHAGVLVISGMARGIDQAAHCAALRAGGWTAGVLGTGFGVDYPRGSRAVHDAVSRSAGLITELLPGSPPRPHHFLARNRIIAGLADLTVVVEGRSRSGALHTARMAAAQGREVWAVPGSINAPASQAPLALIRDGAHVVTRVDDVLAALHLSNANQLPLPIPDAPAQLSDEETAVLNLLGTAVAVSVDELVDRAGQPVAVIMATVGRLRRLGLAAQDTDGVIRTGIGGPRPGRN